MTRITDSNYSRRLPFDELQRIVNEKYYKKRGRKLYSDFKTFGSMDKIAHANAIEFYMGLEQTDDGEEIRVYDFGIGNGLFSRYFLEKFYSLDRKNEFVPRLAYFVCDISEKLVKQAESEMGRFGVHGIICNALDHLPFLKGANYIRSNEMYDDLPAKIFVRNGNEVYEVWMDNNRQKESKKNKSSGITKFMKTMPENYEIPINLGAAKHLETCIKKLKRSGCIDIFDYGFATVTEIKELPAELWNNAIVREFNSQLTIDVNFIYLKWTTQKARVEIKPQIEYAQAILGKKLYYIELEQLYYMEKSEVSKNLKKMKQFGYPSDFLKSPITESDDYKFFRVIK